jgi:hypothetical protein
LQVRTFFPAAGIRVQQHTFNSDKCLRKRSCIQIQKKWWGGNIFLGAVGYRYNLQLDLLPHEISDLEEWELGAWSVMIVRFIFFSIAFYNAQIYVYSFLVGISDAFCKSALDLL